MFFKSAKLFFVFGLQSKQKNMSTIWIEMDDA